MIRTNIYIEEGTRDALAQIAAERGIPAAELTRQLVTFGLGLYDPNSPIADAITEALRVFDDTKRPERALERMAKHWLHNRQSNSIRASLRRIEAKLGIEPVEEVDP